MRKEEADDKKRIIEEAQQILRRDKDNAKSLISALRFSEVKFTNISLGQCKTFSSCYISIHFIDHPNNDNFVSNQINEVLVVLVVKVDLL